MDIANQRVGRLVCIRCKSTKSGVVLPLEFLEQKQLNHFLYVFEVINNVGTLQSTVFARSLHHLLGFSET